MLMSVRSGVVGVLAAAGLLCGLAVHAQAPLPKPETASVSAARVSASGGLPAGRFTSHLEDAGHRLTIDTVRAGGLQFMPVRDERPNFGYSSAAHWLGRR